MAPEFADVIKALVSPREKLISAVQSAIGKAYEPRYIKRIADAKAYEIRTISQALLDSSDVPIVYDKGEIAMDTTDFESLVKRTQNRLAYQELRKQANIEAVVSNAYGLLEGEPPVSSEPIDQDWLNRFFNSVEDVSNEQMQWLWGKLLAGEIKQPQTFSMRTLNLLKNISLSEAELFKKISPYILTCPGDDEKSYVDYFLPTSAPFGSSFDLNKFGISFPDILQLSESGVINHDPMITVSMYLNAGETDWIESSFGSVECFNGSEEPIQLSHNAFVLTESGKELFPVIFDIDHSPQNPEYLEDFLNSFSHSNILEEKTEIRASIVDR